MTGGGGEGGMGDGRVKVTRVGEPEPVGAGIFAGLLLCCLDSHGNGLESEPEPEPVRIGPAPQQLE